MCEPSMLPLLGSRLCIFRLSESWSVQGKKICLKLYNLWFFCVYWASKLTWFSFHVEITHSWLWFVKNRFSESPFNFRCHFQFHVNQLSPLVRQLKLPTKYRKFVVLLIIAEFSGWVSSESRLWLESRKSEIVSSSEVKVCRRRL